MIDKEALLKTAVGPQWTRIGVDQHHGFDLSLLSIRTKDSCGNGEFYDLIPLIDWCKEIGLDVIQLLPINDSGDDPCPYFALSAMALDPLYLSLHKLPNVKKKRLEEFSRFNNTPRVAYHEVQSHKLLFLREYYEEMGPTLIKEKGFIEYVDENPWVETYALFKVLKDLMSKNHWNTWPTELQNLEQKELDNLVDKYFVEVCYHVLIQHLCYEQLTSVRAHANEQGVFLKGDIPILISPDSADVWTYTDQFDLNLSAGSPPDAYCAEGQVWGLPIFRWGVMKEKNYDWWKTRLDYANNFYDIYRIDHVLGFYRIWAIPVGDASGDGKFIPEDQADWLVQGKELLSMLCHHSPMLPIAEDLGVVPDSVRASLSDLGICGTKVVRWERREEGNGAFIDPLHYNPISMSTVSTHDSETLYQWWRDHADEAKAYAKSKGWNYTGTLSKPERMEMLWDSHHSSSLFHVNLLGEYLALFPELIWENVDEERINVPGTVAPTNWTYRIRPSVEEIIGHKPLKEAMKELIKQA